MILQPTKLTVKPLYRWRRDEHYSSRTKWVFQRSVVFVITALATGEQDLEENVSTLLSSIRIRQPASTFMNGLTIPSLTSQPNTTYSRSPQIEGSDYEKLTEDVYDWKIIDSCHVFNDQDKVTHTKYVIAGQWDKYQGLAYGVERRDR